MRKFGLIACLFLLACGGKEEVANPAPADLIPLEKFAEVMTDVQLLEATFNQKMVREDDPVVKMAEFYEQVFEKNAVNRESFESSYQYWSSRPEDMMKIYELMINELTRQEGTINASQQKAPLNIQPSGE